MKTALSEISTPEATFAEDVAAYAEAGLDAIGIWEFKLPDDDAANIELLREHGLEVAICVPVTPSVLPLAIPGMEGPADPAERLESLARSIARFAAYHPACVACLAGPLGSRAEDEGRRLVAAALADLARVARESGTLVGFEPVHVSQRDSAGFVNSLAAADELLELAGTPTGVGLLFDTYHLWDDPSVLPWITSSAHRVAGVHVSDWPALDRTDRVLPGEGISGTAGLVSALAAAGWDGMLDVEIFSTPELFAGLPVGEAARRAHAAATALIAG